MEKVSKKTGTSTNKRKAPVLVPSEDILPHKKIHKFRGEPSVRPKSQDGVLKGPAFRKTGVEAVENAAAVVAGEGSRLLPPPLTVEHTVQESDPGSRHEGKGKERAGQPVEGLEGCHAAKGFWGYQQLLGRASIRLR